MFVSSNAHLGERPNRRALGMSNRVFRFVKCAGAMIQAEESPQEVENGDGEILAPIRNAVHVAPSHGYPLSSAVSQVAGAARAYAEPRKCQTEAGSDARSVLLLVASGDGVPDD